MAKTETDKQITPHVALVPTPGMGHLIPLVELAKRLVHHHNLSATFIIPTSGPPSKAQKSVLKSLPAAINCVFLPSVSMDDLPADTRIETIISLTIVRSLPFIRDAVVSLVDSTRLVALVSDLFGTDAFDVAKEFNLSKYVFFPASAFSLALFLHLPTLDATVSCEYGELEEVTIPGCVPVPGKDLLDPTQDRKNDAYKWVLHNAKRYREADGVINNSFLELEEGPIKTLQEVEPGKPPVYPVGPLVKGDPSSSTEGEVSVCLKWLDAQPHGSVLFVSFGSGGTLSYNQIIELAYGLEMSDQKFLWVVRSPNDAAANATYFSVQSQDDPFAFLPNGFLERTKGKGLVVSSWAPQVQVLSHGSTGGFLTHCGWNSTLESVVNGVPLIAWPLYAEQKMNAVMLTKETQLALRPKPGENGIIGREEIANVVRGLMEGQEGKKIRNRMKDMKEAAVTAIGPDGSSTKALSDVVLKWSNHKS